MKHIHLTPRKRWGYRRAFANQVILMIDRTPYWEKIHHKMALVFDRSVDNHVTFECWMHLGEGEPVNPVYVTFHDDHVFIGTGVRAMDSKLGDHEDAPEEEGQTLIALANEPA